MSTCTVFGGAGNDTISLDGAGGGTVGVYISGDLGNDVITLVLALTPFLVVLVMTTSLLLLVLTASLVALVLTPSLLVLVTTPSLVVPVLTPSLLLVVPTASSSDLPTVLLLQASLHTQPWLCRHRSLTVLSKLQRSSPEPTTSTSGLGTGTAITEINATAAQVLTAGTLFFVRGSLTGNTFTFGSLNGGSMASGLVFAANNNTFANTITSQTHAVYMAAIPVAAGDIVCFLFRTQKPSQEGFFLSLIGAIIKRKTNGVKGKLRKRRLLGMHS